MGSREWGEESDVGACLSDRRSWLEMGGAGSGEHGVGTLKRELFLATRTETELALLRGVKQVFDPKNILNPGTLL